MNYKEFVEDALKNYGELPQETNELYKRHHIEIPFELGERLRRKGARANIAFLSRKEVGGSKIDFDAVISGQDYVINDGSFITIKDSAELDESHFSSVMHKSSEDKYAAFVNAHSKSVIFIDVPYGVKAQVKLRLIAEGSAPSTQIIVSLRNGARLDLTEYYESGPPEGVTGAMHEVRMGEGTYAEINALHDESADATVLCFLKDVLGEGSRLRFNSVYAGGAYTRVRNSVEAASRKSLIEINEMVIGSSAQKFDIDTRVSNSAPETEAELRSKAALSGASLCMLKGFSRVARGAERARSQIRERCMLLDGEAYADALPEMSVDERDAVATHSSATAPVDADELFYLMSRGLAEPHARKLMVAGFLADGVERIEDDAAKQIANMMIAERMRAARG